eukprot:754042-Hanusia_phi.AAC.3
MRVVLSGMSNYINNIATKDKTFTCRGRGERQLRPPRPKETRREAERGSKKSAVVEVALLLRGFRTACHSGLLLLLLLHHRRHHFIAIEIPVKIVVRFSSELTKPVHSRQTRGGELR